VEEAFKGSKADTQIGLGQRAAQEIEKKHDRQVVASALIIVFIIFLAVGWVNFQTGQSFNIPEKLTYGNAIYQTEGEIIEKEDLVKTGEKVDSLEIYVEKAEPGKTYSIPAHKVFVKAGQDYIVYILKKNK
jgi:hypothetical protein